MMPWSLFRLAARRQALRMGSPMALLGKSYLTELDPTTFWETYEILYGFIAACTLRRRSGFIGLYRTVQFHPLYAMTIFTRRYRCMDSRDKLYGILGFLLEPHRALLPPNYLQPVETVKTKFSAVVLAISGSGRLYSYLSVGSRSGRKIPSWVFDLSTQTVDGESNPSAMLMPADQNHFFGASKGRRTQCIPLGPRLIIRGVALDLIDSISNVNAGGIVDAANMYASLVSFRGLAAKKSKIDVSPDNPVARFKHLRAADSIVDVMTCGMCTDSNFHEAFERCIRTGDAPGVASSADSRLNAVSSSSSLSSISSTESEMTENNIQLLVYSIAGRRLIITRSGFFGIGVHEVQAGDLIVVLFGFDVPMVLREQGDHFSMVGAVRIGGVMEGELMEFVDNGALKERTFLIK